MKRGIIFSLLVGLALMLSSQTAFAGESAGRTQTHGAARGQAKQDREEGAGPKSDGTQPGNGNKPERNTRSHPKAEPAPTPVAKEDTGFKARPVSTEDETPKDASEEPISTPTPITVELHFAHVGANSETFDSGSEMGDSDEAVVWHFVLNGLDPDTSPAELTATFREAGTLIATGRSVGIGSTQHFYVSTPSHDVLLGASALVVTTNAGKLVLSDVSAAPEPEEPEEPDEPEEPEEPDEPDDEVDEPDQPEEAAGVEEPFLPFTGEDDVITEAYLPYTGDMGILILGAAAWAATIGGTLRVASRYLR